MIHKLLVFVYRPQACDHDPLRTPHHQDPFDGIELVGIVDTDEQAENLIDRLQNQATPLTASSWAFLIEPVPETIEVTT